MTRSSCQYILLCFFLSCYGHHLDLHSFPTRRSSDLSFVEMYKFLNDGEEPQYREVQCGDPIMLRGRAITFPDSQRSEEHTSELQSQSNLVCRLLPEKKKKPSISFRSRAHPYYRQLPR